MENFALYHFSLIKHAKKMHWSGKYLHHCTILISLRLILHSYFKGHVRSSRLYEIIRHILAAALGSCQGGGASDEIFIKLYALYTRIHTLGMGRPAMVSTAAKSSGSGAWSESLLPVKGCVKVMIPAWRRALLVPSGMLTTCPSCTAPKP